MQPEQPEATEDDLEEQDSAPETPEPEPEPESPEDETAKGVDPAPEEPTPKKLLNWTVIVGLESQQIKLGGSPIYTDVAVVNIKATDVTAAKLEARLALVRSLPTTETNQWHSLYAFLGYQEVVHE